MKLKLLFLFFLSTLSSYGQCWIALNQTSCGSTETTVEILSGTFYDEYQWFYKPISSGGDFQIIAGANNPNLIFDWATYENSFIKVFVATNNFGYDSNIIEISNENCSLTAPDFTSRQLKLFPNPAQDRLFLSQTITGFKIHDMLGQEILSNSGSVINEINIAALPSGIYFLNVQLQDRSSMLKFLKE